MPPPKKLNEFVFLVDMASNEAFLRNALDKIVTFKATQCRGPKKEKTNDLFQLMLVNYPHEDSHARNYMMVTDEKCTLQNNTLFKIFNEHYDQYTEMTHEDVVCDWIEAIKYGAGIFNAMLHSKNIQTRYLIFISDFQKLNVPVNLRYMEVASFMSELDIVFISVIDQHVTYKIQEPLKLNSNEQINYAKSMIQIPAPNNNINVICEVLKDTMGILTGLNNVLNFITFFQNQPPKSNWNVNLTLGDYQFDTVTRKIIEESPDALKIEYKMKKFTYHKQKDENAMDLGDFGDIDELNDNNLGEEVDLSDTVKVKLYHGKPLLVPEDVRKSFKSNVPRTFKILGFVDDDKLSDLYFGGGDTLSITATESSPRAKHFMDFVELVRKEKKIAIAARVYNANTSASLFVLLPRKNWFLMTKLCSGVHNIYNPKPVLEEEVNEDKLSEGMKALRQHLLNAKTVFHPAASLSLQRVVFIENVRKLFGNSIEFYQPESIEEQLTDSTKVLLDKLWQNSTSDKLNVQQN